MPSDESARPATLRPNPAANVVSRMVTAPITVRHDATLGRLARAARRTVLRVSDPTVQFTLDGSELLLPLSHDLPVNRAHFPRYSSNLAEVAAATHRSRGLARPLRIIDIGANIGDSVAIVLAQIQAEFLCVEGDPVFLPYLVDNTSGRPVTIEPSYVDSADVSLQGASVERSSGTARLVPRKTPPAARVVSPQDLVERHPRFAEADLVKIDTDGHDAGIIRSMVPWLRSTRPVLFFEADPVLTRAVGGRELDEVFADLGSAGYEQVMVYDNIGNVIGEFAIDDGHVVDQVGKLGEPGAPPYWDVVATTGRDTGLAATIRV